MEYVLREARAPLPDTWKPGSPLPMKYKEKKIHVDNVDADEKEYDKHSFVRPLYRGKYRG